MVTVILSAYKRLEHLSKQVQHIKDQSIPTNIWIDYTIPENYQMYDLMSLYPDCKITIRPNHNLFHIGRFYHGLNADTEYLFICDDDQLPGRRYLESCINYMEQNGDCIIGAYGVRLNPLSEGYTSKENFGWHDLISKKNNKVQEVDMIGQSWFMKTKHLKVIAYENPSSRKNGEDLFFSFMTQKYSKIPMIILPHTSDNPEEWSTEPNFAFKVGTDKHSTSFMPNHQSLRDKAVKEYRNKGWKLILEK